MHPQQPYLVSAINRWGGRDGCGWDGLCTLRTSRPFFAVNLMRWNGCAVHLYTLHPLLTQRRGLGLCREPVGMRGRTWRASRVVEVCMTRSPTEKVGNATLLSPLSTALLEGMKENSPDDISSCRTLPKVVPSRSASAERVRKRRTTSVIPGRRWGSWSQQRLTRSQRSSVNLGSAGRSGRSPDKTSTTTVAGILLWNGTFPVNTFCTREWRAL